MLKQIKKLFGLIITKSSNYEIFRMTGEDRINFLHNITTTNIKKFEKSENIISQNSLCLDPKGRIITDLTLIKPQNVEEKRLVNNNEEIWIKIPKNVSNVFQKVIKMYSLKKKVEIEKITKFLDLYFIFVN